MHDGETIDLCAPFGAFPGAPRHKNHLTGTVDNSNSISIAKAGGTALAGGGLNKQGEISGIGGGDGGGVEPQQLDVIEFGGGGGGGGGDDDNHIADNVDGFLDDFLALVDDSGSGGEGMDDLMDTDGIGIGNGAGGIAEEDLKWLEDMDLAAFLPPPAAPDAAAAAANIPLPSFAHEIAPVPEPAVVEGGPAAAAAPVVAAAAAASTAPAFAGSGGGAGKNGHNDGGAAANDGDANGGGAGGGGGSGADAAGVSRKEQLRRQKVARYLAKKKNRRWSKTKASSYQSRQRVANSRPRHKGRFLPLESDFVSIEELQRRQRALMKQMQEKAAAAKAAATATATATAKAPSFAPSEGGGGASSLATAAPGAAAASAGNVSPLPLGFGNQVAI